MTPPPIPDSEDKSWAHHAASASLLAPVLVIILNALLHSPAPDSAMRSASGALTQGVVAMLLILAGFAFSIIAWCGISKYGTKRILGRSIVGFIVNGLLILIFVTNFIDGRKKALARMTHSQDAYATARDLKAELAKSYDPNLGITNNQAVTEHLDRLNNQLQSAARSGAGEEAAAMQVVADYLTRMQSCLKKYEATLAEFTEAEVLNPATLTQESQIQPRREVIRQFLAVNAELRQVIVDSEKTIRADLKKARVTPDKIESFMQGFKRSAAPRNALNLQIRDCDQHIGDATLGVLDLFESRWGQWQFDPNNNELDFKNAKANAAYGEYLETLEAAARKQVKLQGDLVKLIR